MNDNDAISRRWLLEQYDAQHEGPAGKARKLIEDAPVVPHEMTAREFAKEFRRMCDAYLNCMEDGDDCPLYTANICSLSEMENIVPIVEQWAKEHPEKKRLVDEDE